MLGNLFEMYGSDKHINGYTAVYESLFLGVRPTALLEVGIGTMIPNVHSSMVGFARPNYQPGGSLRAWRDYFESADIYGIDVQPDTQFSETRIKTYICDSTNQEQVGDTLGKMKFDIIIDDGSHAANDQIQTMKNLLPYLRDDGIYVIEDVHPGSYINTYPQAVAEMFPETMQYLVGKESNQMVVRKRIR